MRRETWDKRRETWDMGRETLITKEKLQRTELSHGRINKSWFPPVYGQA